MPVRMVSAMGASLLSGVVQLACPWAVDQAHAYATEASVVRRARGIIRCLLTGLLAIVAGFVWRVEGGGMAVLPLYPCRRFPSRPPTGGAGPTRTRGAGRPLTARHASSRVQDG